MTDQPEYHAAPDHRVRDLVFIHSRGYACPGDGDRLTIQTKEQTSD